MAKLKATYDEVLELKGEFSLIRPNKPKNLPIEGIHRIMKEQTQEGLEKLGLFDSGSPNYSVYYPDVTPQDLAPEDSDFIYPVYRLLSEVIIDPKYRAVDFSQTSALKKSMPLLVGQSIYIDHETATGTAMGTILEVFWQESYTLGGKTIPAGINGVLKIDGKSNPRIARSIMMDPPSIHSVSVSINFSWKPSHPEMDENEFRNLLGTFAKDGRRVTKVVDNIRAYLELSLVSHGADPFAKQIRDGKIVMATHANKIYELSLSADLMKKQPHMMINPYGNPLPYEYASMSFKAIDTVNTNLFNKNKPESNMELQDLIESLGLSAQGIENEETFIAHIQEQLTLAASATGLKTEVETLTAERDQLQTEVETLTSERDQLQTKVETLSGEENAKLAVIGNTALASARAEAIKFYRLAKANNIDENIEASINTAELAAANSFTETFKAEYEAAVPLTCQDCHSTNVSRKSSKAATAEKLSAGNPIERAKDRAAANSSKNFLK